MLPCGGKLHCHTSFLSIQFSSIKRIINMLTFYKIWFWFRGYVNSFQSFFWLLLLFFFTQYNRFFIIDIFHQQRRNSTRITFIKKPNIWKSSSPCILPSSPYASTSSFLIAINIFLTADSKIWLLFSNLFSWSTIWTFLRVFEPSP